MKEIFSGRIVADYRVMCFECGYIEYGWTKKKILIEKINKWGWKKYKGKWHCDKCALFKSEG